MTDDAARAVDHFTRATTADPGAERLVDEPRQGAAAARRRCRRARRARARAGDRPDPSDGADPPRRTARAARRDWRWRPTAGARSKRCRGPFPDPTPELARGDRPCQGVSHRPARSRLSDALDAALAAPLAAASPRDRRRFAAANDFMLGRRSIFHNQCHGFSIPSCPPTNFSTASISLAGRARGGDRQSIREELAGDPRQRRSGAGALCRRWTRDAAQHVDRARPFARLERAPSVARRRADRRGLRARPAHRGAGRAAAAGAHSRARAGGLLLDPQGRRALSRRTPASPTPGRSSTCR